MADGFAVLCDGMMDGACDGYGGYTNDSIIFGSCRSTRSAAWVHIRSIISEQIGGKPPRVAPWHVRSQTKEGKRR